LGFAGVAGVGFAGVIRASGVTLPELPPTREARLAAECDANLAAIDLALAGWYQRHSPQTLPDSLVALAPLLEDVASLVCPAGDAARVNEGNVSYDYVKKETGGSLRESVEVRCPIHGGVRVFPVLARYGVAPRVSRPGTPDDSPTNGASTGKDMSSERLKALQSRAAFMMRYGLVPHTTNPMFATNLPPTELPGPVER
jgi:hypothetical protein